MVAADYAISTCFTDARGLYVNLYVPAQVVWNQDGKHCALSVETGYPYAPGVTMTLKLSGAQTFTLNLRIPAWAQGAELSINGRRETPAPQPGRFASLRREWRSADRIELHLPLLQRLEAVDAAHADTVAVLAGPLVLMRILGEDGGAAAPLTRTSLLEAQRVGEEQHQWEVHTNAGQAQLMPFLDIGAERYSAYQEVAPS